MLYNQSLVNLHTHSFYCKHGTGTIAQFVSQAKEDGLRVLGFSEHCPLPDREYQKGNRMDYPDLPFYEADVRAQMNDPDIRVLLGAECDWLPDEESFYRDGLLGERGYDYLCCSIHHMVDPSDGREKF
ncbi:MAG: PHP domain-containing protein, partial [Spirochaetales bacterium]|nr:PHP domain-containing protein [Spirochaetales bacterium]